MAPPEVDHGTHCIAAILHEVHLFSPGKSCMIMGQYLTGHSHRNRLVPLCANRHVLCMEGTCLAPSSN